MNQLMIIVIALVVFFYFGGKYVPKVLKDNKQIMLGLVGGLVLCSFMCKSVEGFVVSNDLPDPAPQLLEQACNYYLQNGENDEYCNSENLVQFTPGKIAVIRSSTGVSKEFIASYITNQQMRDCEYCRTLPSQGCEDRYSTELCNQYISSGTLSCENDFAPGGTYQGGCDLSCGCKW